MKNWLQMQQIQSLTSRLNQNRINIQSAVNSDISWAKTVDSNPTMSCLGTGGCGGMLGALSFNLLDVAGNPVIYNGETGFTGYNLNGSLCTSSCPITLQLSWIAVCNLSFDPACKNPFIKVIGIYTAPASLNKISWTKYNFEVLRQAIATSPCPGVAPACAAPLINVCTGAGWSGCIAPGCAAKSMSWTIGGFACTGLVPDTVAGLNSAPVVSTSGNAGSAVFNCSSTGSGAFAAIPVAGATCAGPTGHIWTFTSATDAPAACVPIATNDCTPGHGCPLTGFACPTVGATLFLPGACSNIPDLICKCVYSCI